MTNNVKKFFQCECGVEGIIVEKDLEDDIVYLECYTGSGFYTNQQPLKKFFYRFLIALKIILHGEYSFFEIILSQNTADALAEELLCRNID